MSAPMAATPVHLLGVARGHSRLSYLGALVLFAVGVVIAILGLSLLFPLVADMSPAITTYLFLFSIIMTLPVALLVARWVHKQRPMELIAPGCRLDVGMILRSALVFAVPLLVQFLYGYWSGEIVPVSVSWAVFLSMLPLTLLAFILQASTEEVIFRGYLAQGLQVLFRHAVPAALVGALLFTLAHEGSGRNAVWSQRIQIALMALFLSWLTARLGRLEAAMGVHIVNNLLFVLLIGDPLLPLPALTSVVDPDPPDIASLGELLELLTVQGASLIFYWWVGVRSGFIAGRRG